MNTKDLAASLVGLSEEETYRKLILFLAEYSRGYGVTEGDRGAARSEAESKGYFWLPCVLCGEWWGGQEPHVSLNLTVNHGVGVCSSCQEEAARLNVLYPNGVENGK